MTIRQLPDVHQAMANDMKGTTFSYTCCMNLYASLKSVPYSSRRFCVQELYQTERSHCSLYTRGTTLRLLPDVHQAMINNMERTTFSYTCCSDLHDSLQSVPYSSRRFCVQELYQTGRSHCSLYTWCTTIRPLKQVHYAVMNNLQQTEFLYTCCTDLYSSPKLDALQLQ